MKEKLSLIFVIFWGSAVLFSQTFGGVGSLFGEELTFEQRVHFQKKVEEIFYQHRTWLHKDMVQPLFEDMKPETIAREKVQHYLIESKLLDELWHRPLTHNQLQSELNRIVLQSRDPERLAAIFGALNENSFYIAECVVRPLLAHRLSRKLYACDVQIHQKTKKAAEQFRKELSDKGVIDQKGPDSDILYIKVSAHPQRDPLHEKPYREVDLADFTRISDGFPEKIGATSLTETDVAFIVRRTLERSTTEFKGYQKVFRKETFDSWFNRNKGRYGDPTALKFPAYTYTFPQSRGLVGDFTPDSWLSENSGPSARDYASAVWTGSEMIVWGGQEYVLLSDNIMTSSGSAYNPVTDSWRSISTVNAPEPRIFHTAIWTGAEMLIWGGIDYNDPEPDVIFDNGARYNPVLDAWFPMSAINTPSARYHHSAVWTGNEMIIWGGRDDASYVDSGSKYDPNGNAWTAISITGVPTGRINHSAVWTGECMVVWGGYWYDGTQHVERSGGRYYPVSDTWLATNLTGAPVESDDHSAIAAGTEMILWGITLGMSDGCIYDPEADDWSQISHSGLTSRSGHTAIWTGSEMLVWGGWYSDPENHYLNSGAMYNRGEGSWTAMTTTTAPSGRYNHLAVWTGTEMLVWGGKNPAYLGDGFRYHPLSDEWNMMLSTAVPADRFDHTAVWTGNELIIWGGLDYGEVYLNSGYLYYPFFHAWEETPTTNAPPARAKHTTIWTGMSMIVWGGKNGSGIEDLPDEGGMYRPLSPPGSEWDSTNSAGAPPGRRAHSAVWTGVYMIIWGGIDATGDQLNTGMHFRPSHTVWSALNSNGGLPPLERYSHSAVWAEWSDGGTNYAKMIIYGGGYNRSAVLYDGAMYDPIPSHIAWTEIHGPTSSDAVLYHTAVWTGSKMIVWGGEDDSFQNTQNGFVYDPVIDGITNTSLVNAPTRRSFHSAIWTGKNMIIWGGRSPQYLGDGSIYNPDSNTWQSLPQKNSPTYRNGHATTWTGQEMIIYGGYPNTGFAMYFPNTPPYSSPMVLNTDSSVTLGSTPTLNLSHSLPTFWFDNFEGDTSGWSATGDWQIIEGGNCSGSSDYSSPLHAWYCGNPETCDYAGESDTGILILSAINVSPNENFLFSFKYFLNTDALKGDIAQVRVGVCTYLSCYWETVATDKHHWTSSADGYQLDDDCTQWQKCEINLRDFFPQLPIVDTIEVRFSFNRDSEANDHVGWFIDDVGLGEPSGDGSNPETTFAYHDRWDSASFEWDLDHDAVADNAETSTPVFSIPLENLGLYNLDRPGDYTVQLSVMDSLGLSDINFTVLHVLDGLDPDATLITPNGGESWAYSPESGDPVQHLIVWNASDNHRIAHTTVSYSTGPGKDWTEIATYDFAPTHLADDLPQAIRDVNTPGEEYDLILTDNKLIEDLEVMVSLSHGRLSDLTIALRAPDMTEVILSDQNGGEGTAYTDTVFDDDTNVAITDAFPPYTGYFKPEESLDIFHGYLATGEWTLRIEDSVSGEEGTLEEWGLVLTYPQITYHLWDMPTAAEAALDNQNFPSSECKVKIEAKDTADNSATDESDQYFYIVQPTTSSIKTIILWNSERMCSKYETTPPCDCEDWSNDTDCTIMNNLYAKLTELADHPRISGAILDLNVPSTISNAYTAWEADLSDQNLANAVAQAIWDYLYDPATGQISTTYTNVEYIILVGDDYQVPFYRMNEGVSIKPEMDYSGVLSSTTVGAALAANKFLTDNFYSEMEPEASFLPSNASVYHNDFAIGRLVETPEEMTELINTYLAFDGEISVTTANDEVLITGYDFCYDSGLAIKELYESQQKTTDCLLDDPRRDEPTPLACTEPLPDIPFNSSELKGALLGEPIQKIASINGHAHHYAMKASVSPFDLSTTDMETAPNNGPMPGTFVYTPACHAGLPVPPKIPDDETTLDMPEEMAKKSVLSYIANTGYGWGMDNGIGLSELLMLKITEELLDHESISTGKALSLAKREYYMEEKRYDVFDEKVIHEATLFGIPNTLITTQKDKYSAKSLPLSIESPDGSCDHGICMNKKELSGIAGKGLPPGVTQFELNFTFEESTYQLVNVPDKGAFYTLNGIYATETGHPHQPKFVFDSTLSGTAVHSVLFTGGTYREQNDHPVFDPVVAVPISTEYINHTENEFPMASKFTPAFRTTSASSWSATKTSKEEAGWSNMTVLTGYYILEDSLEYEYLFDSMQFVIYYSNSSDTDLPVINTITHSVDGMDIHFTVVASDNQPADPTDGIFRVLITYNDKRPNEWKSVDLLYNTTTGKWEGNLRLTGSIFYLVQVVDKAGNKTMLFNTGDDKDSENNNYGSTYSIPVTYDITLADTEDSGQGDGIPDLWEDQYPCVDSTIVDDSDDPDKDLLTNLDEFIADTNPCNCDTDFGGDNDGSELANGRNPKNIDDDIQLTILPSMPAGPGTVLVEWPDGTIVSPPCLTETNLDSNNKIDGPYWLYRSSDPFFSPEDLLMPALPAGEPIADGVTCYEDSETGGSIFYYKVWNTPLEGEPPQVHYVEEPSGVYSAEQWVYIYGDYFTQGATVTFCDDPAEEVDYIFKMVLRVKRPSYLSGSGCPCGPCDCSCDVRVTNPNGQFGLLDDGFTYLDE